MATDVYLVHASENSSGVQALAEALRSRGLLVWFITPSSLDRAFVSKWSTASKVAISESLCFHLRLQIVSGFDWVRPPVIMPKSLAVYERNFADDYYATELVYFPASFTRPPGQPVPLSEIVRAHPLWDGERVTLIARQVEGTVQVLEELVTEGELPSDPTRPSGAGIAAYVFQLDSVGFSQGELCYVHCIGPYARTNAGMGPNSHDQESLCWVTGLVMAFGFLKNSRGHAVNSIYVAASVVFFTPKMESTDSTC